jgi:hypothetical protein
LNGYVPFEWSAGIELEVRVHSVVSLHVPPSGSADRTAVGLDVGETTTVMFDATTTAVFASNGHAWLQNAGWGYGTDAASTLEMTAVDVAVSGN